MRLAFMALKHTRINVLFCTPICPQRGYRDRSVSSPSGAGRDRHLGTLEPFEPSRDAAALGLSISPDGMSVLYLRHMNDSADLMLIENFR
jgi:hypothetical protein